MTEEAMFDFDDRNRISEDSSDGTPLWWKIQSLVDRSDQLFVKKLSRNDTSWADAPNLHQAGFYIPRPIRESGFFPELTAENPDKPHIFSTRVTVLWPQTGEVTVSGMRHYSNKGPETHFTRLPKALFRNLTPASLLLSGRFGQPVAECGWWIVILDSAGVEAELLETILDLPVDFHYSLFSPNDFKSASRFVKDELEELIDRFRFAMKNGTVGQLVAEYAAIPDPAETAREARELWLMKHGLQSFDPWQITAPGDAIMEISRDIEYRIYRKHELRRRASELLAILTSEPDLPSAIIRRYADIDAIMLSASQQRKSRAGRSFEQHIAEALKAGRIRFTEQAVTGGRRPDFVLPDVKTLKSQHRSWNDALVLSAKTTLRERWKQVSSERLSCDIFLATVDDRVTSATINEMADAGIWLVVPESLKSSKEACYQHESNTITFNDFFKNHIQKRRPFLISAF